MKYIPSLCLASLLLLSAPSFADAPGAIQPVSIASKDPNQIYYGLEFIAYHLDVSFENSTSYGNRYFSGSKLGYQYLKPNAFYAGVDLTTTTATVDFDATLDGHAVPWQRADRYFSNFDARFGYTAAPGQWLISPFAGFGIYVVNAIDHHNDEGFKQDLPYLSTGIRSIYTAGPLFSVGLNLQFLSILGAQQTFKYNGGKTSKHYDTWGAKIGMPFMWHLASNRWQIIVEPYFLDVDFTTAQNIYGTSILFAYRF